MDWNEGEHDRQALTRIVEMLVALAFLAECASRRSRPVRCMVLWILRPAEAIAREFVAALAHQFAFAEFPAVRSRDSSADAITLALRLRALAAELDDLSSQGRRLTPRNPRDGRVRHPEVLFPNRTCEASRLLAEANSMAHYVWEKRPNDTS